MKKMLLKLCYYEIKLKFYTITTTFSLYFLYTLMIPLFIGFWPELLYQFHLGVIWTSLLFSFLPERFFQTDLDDGTMELYFLSNFNVKLILYTKLIGYWILKISCILFSYPILALFYHFKINVDIFITLMIGSFLFLLISNIYSCFTLSVNSHDWNSIQYLTTLPALLPLILFCSYLQYEKVNFLFLIGYLILYMIIYSVIVSISLKNILKQ
uniref:Channel subunit of ABC transporter for cytochrome c1 n=1 Tax=Roya anglica TaxID=43943 RepID=A0A6G9IFZ1_9VIRI|nr:channel subunit of ABC transporter for cytochrome c1 [Roya anglica]QIQ22981.1 channel subunit of ABC transporter for cytochrome c1 [Roya anglica]